MPAKFNEKSTCSKCGHEGIATIYCHEGRSPVGTTTYHLKIDEKGEFFHRQCKRCGYNWVELCLSEEDLKKKEEEKAMDERKVDDLKIINEAKNRYYLALHEITSLSYIEIEGLYEFKTNPVEIAKRAILREDGFYARIDK